MNLIKLRQDMHKLHLSIWLDIVNGDYASARESLTIMEMMAEQLPSNNKSTTLQAIKAANAAIEKVVKE